MLKKLLAFILSATLLLLCPVQSMAISDNDINVSFNTVDSEITVSGEGSGNLLITIVSEDVNIESLSESVLPDIYKQVKAFGNFKVTLSSPSSFVSGKKYFVHVSAPDGTEGVKSFKYFDYDSGKVAEIIEILTSQAEDGDTAAFKKTISDNSMALCIDTEKPAYKDNFDMLCTLLMKYGFGDFAKFSHAFNYAEALIAVEEADKASLDEVLKSYADVLSFDYKEKITDNKTLSEDVKEELYSLICDASFAQEICEDKELTFSGLFEDYLLVAKANDAGSYIALQKIISEEYELEMEELLTSDKYEKVKNTEGIYKLLYKALPCDDIKELKELFEDKINEVYKSEKKKNEGTSGGTSGGSSGGSFGGGSSNVAVTTPSVTPVAKPEEVSPSYIDINSGHWSYEAVSSLSKIGAVKGYPDGSFKPQNAVTRAEFAAMLSSFTFALAGDGESVKFDDVRAADWYSSVVTEAARKGLILGFEGKFSPNDKIKREDAALIIYRLLIKKGKELKESKNFGDSDTISEYAKAAVEAMGSAGYVNGNENGDFMPQLSITRAEAAQIIYNALLK